MYSKLHSKFLTLLISGLLVLTALPLTSFAAEVNEFADKIAKAEDTFRFAAVADVHAMNDYKRLGETMDALSAVGGVDAMALVGDITYNDSDHTNPKVTSDETYEKLNAVLDAKGYAVPSDSVGTVAEGKIPLVYAIGNHEFPLNDRTETIAASCKALFVDKMGIPDSEKDGNWMTEIEGYTFIMSAAKDYFGDYKASESWVLEQIAIAEAKNEAKPIFYLQHHPINGFTTPDSVSSYNSPEFFAELKNHPRVIVLNAHSHHVAEDTRTISQDGFTTIRLPRLSGGNVSAQGGKYELETFDDYSSVAFLFDVTRKADGNDEITINRMDILSGKVLGNPYTFTAGDVSKYTQARYDMDKSVAAFAADDELSIENKDGSRDVKVTFPVSNVAVTAGEDADFLQDNFVHSYKVVIKNTDISPALIKQEFNVFGEFWKADMWDSKLAKSRNFEISDLERDTNYKVSVYPMTTYQTTMTEAELLADGVSAIEADFTSSNDKTEEDKALISKKLLNVALNKPVLLGNGGNENALYPLARFTDGKSDTFGVVDGTKTFTIDLERRYNIEKIELVSRMDADVSAFCSNFKIYGSNDLNNLMAEELINYGAYDAEKFPVKGNYTENIDKDGDFRYITFESPYTYYYYGELRVFAYQDVTEVSRNKNIVADSEHSSGSYPAKKAVNGTISSAADMWFASDDANYHLATIDLEKARNIGLIELYGRNDSASVADNWPNRLGWDIYGSNEFVSPSELASTSKITNEAYTKLYGSTEAAPSYSYKSDDNYFPRYQPDQKPFAAVLDDSQSYRYLTIKQSQSFESAISEIRAYVLNPMVNSMEISDGNVILNFSDVMDEATITSENIKLYDESGESLDIVPVLSDDGFSISFATEIKGGRVVISDDVKNAYGVDLAEDKEFVIENTSVNYEGLPSKTVEVNVAQYKKVTGDGTEHKSYPIKNINDGNRQTMTALSDSTIKGFTVDLEKRYNIKRIELISRQDGANDIQSRQYFEIWAAKNEDFSDGVKLGGFKTQNAELFPSAGTYTITLDGNEDYRYVKLVKTGQVSSGYGEIKVFADVDVTQVSKKGNSTTANSWYLKDNASYPSDPYNPKNILDGNTGTFTMQNAQKYNYITVDLGEAYPIGMVEMDKRSDGSDLYTFRKDIYGSNTLMSGDTANEDVANLSSYGYTKLATIQDEWQFATSADKTGYLHPDRQFRLDDSYPSYREMMAGSDYYRYITLKSNYLYGFNELSEFRAYVVNPKVNGVEVDGNNITVRFSDTMIVSLLNEDNISLMQGNTQIAISDIEVSKDKYEVSFKADLKPGASYSVVVNKDVRSTEGVTMKEDKTISFETEKLVSIKNADGEAVQILAPKTEYTVDLNVDFDENTDVIYLAYKNATTNILTSVVILGIDGNYNFTTPESVENSYVEIFIWDKTSQTPVCDKTTLFK